MKFYDDENSAVNCRHIDVLDGIRALGILIVVWLHIWEQNWLMPILDTPSLAFLGIHSINLDWIPRTGYMMVNLIIFISGFCLYLPYARHTVYGEKLPSLKSFAKKRFARILPSYLFCVLAIFAYNIITSAYTSPECTMYGDSTFMWKDLITRLTFTFNLIPSISMHSLLNGALWTVALEVQFYIIFPLLAKGFLKKPILTYSAMSLVSFAFIYWANGKDTVVTYMHQLPSYLGIFANGFLGALLFTYMTKSIKRNKYIAIISTVISIICCYGYYLAMKGLRNADYSQKWQMNSRFLLSMLFIIFVISSAYSLPFYRKIYSNKVAVFFSTISFNLYMWHQFIGGALKKHRIPYYPDYPDGQGPNQVGDKTWMWGHFILSIVISIIIATLTTYLIEKPFSKYILNKKKTEENPKNVPNNASKRRKGLSSK